MGRGLCHWTSHVLTQFLPVLPNLLLLFYVICLFSMMPPSWDFTLVLLGVYLFSALIHHPPKFNMPSQFHLPKKRMKKWRRRRLPYWLVMCCWARYGQRPWDVGVAAYNYVVTGPEVRFRLHEPVTPIALEMFCGGTRDFTTVPRLLRKFKFRGIDHEKQVAKVVRRANVLSNSSNGDARRGLMDPKTLMLIWDTGASFGLTPFRSDFIDYVPCNIPVKDVTKVNRVIGIGTTLHKFVNTNGKEVFLPCVSYHLPTTDVRLFSPQTFHQMHGG